MPPIGNGGAEGKLPIYFRDLLSRDRGFETISSSAYDRSGRARPGRFSPFPQSGREGREKASIKPITSDSGCRAPCRSAKLRSLSLSPSLLPDFGRPPVYPAVASLVKTLARARARGESGDVESGVRPFGRSALVDVSRKGPTSRSSDCATGRTSFRADRRTVHRRPSPAAPSPLPPSSAGDRFSHLPSDLRSDRRRIPSSASPLVDIIHQCCPMLLSMHGRNFLHRRHTSLITGIATSSFRCEREKHERANSTID